MEPSEVKVGDIVVLNETYVLPEMIESIGIGLVIEKAKTDFGPDAIVLWSKGKGIRQSTKPGAPEILPAKWVVPYSSENNGEKP